MGTSFITMLNRLPIYSRPKEPAIGIVIGNPVLVETTNPNLPTIPIQPRYDHFGNSTAISPDYGNTFTSGGKRLPPLPSQSSSQHPPPRVIPFRLPTQDENYNQNQFQYNTNPYSQSPSPPPFGNNNASKATSIPRKPAPSQYGSTASRPTTAQTSSEYSNYTSTTVTGNNMWDNYKNNASRSQVDLFGRRKAEKADPPPPVPPPRAPSRIPQTAPQLKLNTFAFEPLSNNSKEDLPGMPSTNSFKVASPTVKTKTEEEIKMYAAGSTDYILKTLAESINLGRPQAPPQPPKPKDHITELEDSREALVSKRIAISKEICEMEQAISPASPHALKINTFTRAEIRERIEAKKADLAAVEKEIFDVGMLIHRAWKRRCKDGSEGPTHLWIHNVAGRDD